MSIIKKISIKNAIQQAQDNMGIDHNRYIPLFTAWAVEADRKIGSYYSYKKKIVVLKVEQCRAQLPCESVAVLAVVYGDRLLRHDCNSLFNDVHRRIQTDNFGFPTLIDGGWSDSNFWGCNGVRYEIQNNQLVFSNNFNTHNFHADSFNSDHHRKVTVQILALEVDQEGFPLINENHVDAVAQYIEYKNALKTRWNSIENKITETGIADMKMEWGRKCRDARADDGDPSESDLAEIRNMINNPLSGVGIALYVFNNPWIGWY